jgi:hypothetical protein
MYEQKELKLKNIFVQYVLSFFWRMDCKFKHYKIKKRLSIIDSLFMYFKGF